MLSVQLRRRVAECDSDLLEDTLSLSIPLDKDTNLLQSDKSVEVIEHGEFIVVLTRNKHFCILPYHRAGHGVGE